MHHDVRKETAYVGMSDISSDSGDLSLSFSFSSEESYRLDGSELNSALETIEPYQFEPVASESVQNHQTRKQMMQEAILKMRRGFSVGTGRNSLCKTDNNLYIAMKFKPCWCQCGQQCAIMPTS